MGEVADLIGRTIAGRFVIEHHIGGGAMGEVFRARHVTLDSVVAVKIMRSDIAKEPMYKERFYREAKAASRLEHANSVRVLDFGQEPDGLLYLAMEFLSGRDLLTVIRENWPIGDERIVDILAQTLSAVSGAHALGIVHRDLKPENIMIATSTDDDGKPRDVVKVCDFGIAKTTDKRAFTTENDGKALTSSGMLIGTPEYMSPEQARGDPLDARSDLYSIGVVLYQMLTGRVPFTAENALGIVLKQVTDEPAPPEKHRPGVNPRLSAICLRALRKDREARYQSAREMRADLRAVFGYRSPIVSSSDDSSAQIVMPPADAHSAPTIAADVPMKRTMTSDGTEITIPVTSTRRTLAGLVALVAVGAVVVIGGLMMSKRETKSGGDPPPEVSVSASAAASAVASASVNPPTLVPLSTTTSVSTAPRGTTRPTSTTKATATTSATVVASAPPPEQPAPSYNPSAANVVLRGLTTERVAKAPISAMMAGVVPRLTECYQLELRTLGKPVGGSAQIQMSFDGSGKMQPLVMAQDHPQFARCAQGVLGGLRAPPNAVEPEGGTATQWLGLNP
jgi:serine/threonine protein kinase